MEVNYKQIILNGYLYARNKPDLGKYLIAHFTREAEMAKYQHIEYDEFFSNLKRVVEKGKAVIEKRYKNLFTKNDSIIEHIISRNKLNRKENILHADENIFKVFMKELYKDKNSIKFSEFLNNNSYKYRMIDVDGNSIHLTYKNLELIDDAVERSKMELSGGYDLNQKPLHFTKTFTKRELKILFKGLIKEKLLAKNTIFNHFCYAFGGVAIPDSEEPFEALIWEGNVSLLAYLVDMLFADSDKTKLWEITSKCFICKGKIPNKDTMKNCVYKYAKGYCEKPKEAEIINSIILNKL